MNITKFDNEFRFLSNFFSSPLSYEGIDFPTVEHAYQASKILYVPAKKVISELPTPGKAKQLGRALSLRPDWDLVKTDIMMTLLYKKFKHEELAKLLISTGESLLIEGNTWGDRFWGMEYVDEAWVGKNTLGNLLMMVRDDIQKTVLV